MPRQLMIKTGRTKPVSPSLSQWRVSTHTCAYMCTCVYTGNRLLRPQSKDTAGCLCQHVVADENVVLGCVFFFFNLCISSWRITQIYILFNTVATQQVAQPKTVETEIAPSTDRCFLYFPISLSKKYMLIILITCSIIDVLLFSKASSNLWLQWRITMFYVELQQDLCEKAERPHGVQLWLKSS